MSVPRPAGTALLVLCLLALPAALGVALAADDGERDAPSAEGRVLSAGGSPLAGADVALYPCLDARAAAALALAGRAATPAARGKTGADGRFALAAPKPGVYVARIETKGTVPLTTAPLALVEPTALEDARLERDAGLVVAVADGASGSASSAASAERTGASGATRARRQRTRRVGPAKRGTLIDDRSSVDAPARRTRLHQRETSGIPRG